MGKEIFLGKKKKNHGKSGNNLPHWEAVRQQLVYPAPRAFNSTGYRSVVWEGVKREAAAAFARAWAMLEGPLPARGVDAVFLKGRRQLGAEDVLQRRHQHRRVQPVSEQLNPFPDLVAGLVQAVRGSVLMDPGVPRDRSQGELTLRYDDWSWSHVRTGEHLAGSGCSPMVRLPGGGGLCW